MKLSQAIREGAKLNPQGFGQFFSDNRSCALGAAYDAALIHTKGRMVATNGYIHEALVLHFPVLTEMAECPSGVDVGGDVYHIIAHLNDECQWTREEIADWVQSIEDAGEVVAT